MRRISPYNVRQGEGTAASPYLITNVQELDAMRHGLHAHYQLAANIDLTATLAWGGGRGWTPVGGSAAADRFRGRFNGAGFILRNLAINRSTTDYQGLFAYAQDAVIEGVVFEQASVQGQHYTAALVGWAENCALARIDGFGQVNAVDDGGGLVGRLNGGRLFASSVGASVQGRDRVGGLVGYMTGGSSLIQSSARGSVTGRNQVGGVVGYQYGQIVSDCYSRAAVTGASDVGGMVGYLYYSRLRRGYSAGPVSGSGSGVGGYVGRSSSSTEADGFWDEMVSGLSVSAGGAARTTEQMKQQATYGVFNFQTIWRIEEGIDYPTLQRIAGYVEPPEVALDDLDGSGTVDDPYLITTPAALRAMGQDLAAHYRLGGDLDLSDSTIWNAGSGWAPIGTSSVRFTGTFDGGGYAIRNLTINRPESDYQGFFGYLQNATVRNLRLEGVTVYGNRYVGILAGRADTSTIDNVAVSGLVRGHNNEIGGLVGYVNGGTIHRATTDIRVQGVFNVGGLVGYTDGGVQVRHSASFGQVAGSGNTIGGLSGYHRAGTLADCYSGARASGPTHVGGLVGYNGSSGYWGNVYRCFSFGAVSGDSGVGGLIGTHHTGNVTDSFWDKETSGLETSAGGSGAQGRTTTAMWTRENYAFFNFDTVWRIAEGESYPTFQDFSRYDLPGAVALGELQGEGTAASPYLLHNASEVNAMRLAPGAHYRLAQDIDLADTAIWNAGQGWLPVGTSGVRFTGSLDGAGFALRNLTINRPDSDYQGLYGYVQNATVRNLRLADASIAGNRYTGILAGRADTSTIDNAVVSGVVRGHNNEIGGLVGYVNGGTIHRATTDVRVQGVTSVGGLVGYTDGGVQIRHSASFGQVAGSGNSIGGLAGYHRTGTLADCYSGVRASGPTHVGGLVGYGGNLGYWGNVHRCFSFGAVIGDSGVGGLIGTHHTGNVTDSFWDKETSGQETSAGGSGAQGRTTTAMWTRENYAFFNFDAVWRIAEGESYPTFQDFSRYDLPGAVALGELQGEGTAASPCLLHNASEVNAMRLAPGAHYRLAQDIDLADTAIWNAGQGWLPVGTSGVRFTGSLDGAGFALRNLTINRPDSAGQGLFGYLGVATVRSLRLENAHVHGLSTLGALAGQMSGAGLVEDVSVTTTICGRTDNVGGVIGDLQAAQVRRISAVVEVGGGRYVGGLVGYTVSSPTLSQCYSLGRVQGSGNDIGGVVGWHRQGTLSDSYSGAAVGGGYNVGGLVGYAGGSGGYWGNVDRGFSFGAVSGASGLGGLIGYRYDGSVTDCFWDKDTSGQASSSGGGTGLATDALQQAATFSGWNFEDVWTIDAGQSYPYHRDTPRAIALAESHRAFSNAAVTGQWLRVTGNIAWTATASAGWITIDEGASGVGDGVVRFSLAANASGAPRSGTITVSTGAGAVRVFQIEQRALLLVVPEQRQHDASASGGHAVEVGGNVEWTASSDAAWLDLTGGTNGSGDGTLHYRVLSNASLDAREGVVTIAGGGLSREVAIRQAGSPAFLAVVPHYREHGGAVSTGNTVEIESNHGWTATKTVPWLTITGGASGTGSATLTYSLDLNDTSAERMAWILVQGAGRTATFRVVQAPELPSEMTLYTIETAVQPPDAGSVTPGASLYGNEYFSATATVGDPEKYVFRRWLFNGQVVSYAPSHSFAVQGSGTLVAEFERTQFAVTASVSPAGLGSVSGTGLWSYGIEGTLTANPVAYCSFVAWRDGATDVVVSTSRSYTFSVTAPRHLVAVFEEDVKEHEVTTATAPPGLAEIPGAGTWANGQTATFVAPAMILQDDQRYVFQRFTRNGAHASSQSTWDWTFTRADPAEMLVQAEYQVYDMSPAVREVRRTFDSPVPATDSQVVTIVFDRTMDTGEIPLAVMRRRSDSAERVLSTEGGQWLNINTQQDAYRYDPLTFVPDDDGEYDLTVSGARDTYGVPMEPTNVWTFVVHATPPTLTLPDLQTEINELVLFEFPAHGADGVPGNPLVFSLTNAPAGAGIHPQSGLFSWTPSERQGPGRYTFGVRLDDGLGRAIQAVTIDVLEVNRPPILNAITDRTIQGETTLAFQAVGSDPDISAGDIHQSLTYRLEGNVPAGATITASGHFSWTPTGAQIPGEYTMDVVVSDGELEARRSFTIYTFDRPDLTVTQLELPSLAPMEGEAVRLRARIDNIGDGKLLQNIYVGFYVNGNLIGNQWISSSTLPNGQYCWVERIWTAVPGTHTIEVRADYLNQVQESREDNNSLSETLAEIIAPDIAVTNASWLPVSINEGEKVRFFFDVSNLGGATARDVDVHLKVDGAWVVSDRIRGPFGNRTESLVLEWTATPGPHAVEIVADRYGKIFELNRANNVVEISMEPIEDTLPPTFTSLVPGNGQRIRGVFALNVAATDISGISRYQIEYSSDELFWTTLHEGASGAGSWNTTLLADGVYAVRFSAEDTRGNVRQVTHMVTVDNTPPAAVTLSAQPIEFGAVLNWAKPTESDYSFCRIFRSASPDGPFVQLNATIYSQSSYTDRQLSPGASYSYVVRAYDMAGNVSDDSNVVTVTPNGDQSPPEIRSLSPAENSAHNTIIHLSADIRDNVGVTLVRYAFAEKPAGSYALPDLSWTVLSEGTAMTRDWDVTELATGRYLILLTAWDAAGLSSSLVRTYLVDHVPPGSVGEVTIQRRELALAVAWSSPGDSDLVGYRLWRQVNGGAFTVLKERLTSTLYVDTNLQPDVLYAYRVEAEDMLGHFGVPSDSPAVTTLRDTTDPILVGVMPSAWSRHNGVIDLALLATDNDAMGSGAFWYRLVGNANWLECSGTAQVLWQAGPRHWRIQQTWNPDGLPDGEIEIRARAEDRSNNSLETTFILVRDTEAPAPPQGLSATDPQTGSSIQLNWSANSESDFAQYRIYQRASGESAWQLAGSSVAQAYSVQSLQSDQAYQFAVSAVDLAGNESPLSNISEIATTTRADLTIQSIVFDPRTPAQGRLGHIVARVLNRGPARAQVTVRFYVSNGETEAEVGIQHIWMNGQAAADVRCPWIPQNGGSQTIRAAAVVAAPAVDPTPGDNDLSRETLVNSPPVAVAGSDRSVDWYEEIAFDGSGSSDADGRIMEYLWNFGDGNTKRGMNVVHRYEAVGVQTVTLTVTDDRGVSSTDSILVTVADTRADLIVEKITWMPGEPEEGDEITIIATIRNQGNGPTRKAFFATYYISGVYHGYVIVNELIAAGDAVDVTFLWTATKGLHTVRVVADDLINAVNELSEANNYNQVHMTFQQIHFPDLLIADMTCPLPATITSQEALKVTLTVQNAGTADAENIFVALYQNGKMISRKPLPDLVASGTLTTTFDVIPVDGTNTLTAIVDDPVSLIVESDETNNSYTLELGDLTVQHPDLQLELTVQPDQEEMAHGSWIDMSATVKNLSAVGLLQTAPVDFYVNGIRVGTREIRHLASGASKTVAFQVSATEGVHEIRVVVNEKRTIAESDYSNNEQSHTTKNIRVLYSDLTVGNVSWFTQHGGPVKYGDQLIVTFDLSNLTLVSSYDRSSVILLVNGKRVSKLDIGSIRGYETVHTGLLWRNVDVDPTVPHTIAVQVDPDNVIPEENEDNNIATAAMQLTLEDGLIVDAELDREDDEVFGIPVYISSETCRVSARASYASAPKAWLDTSVGQTMTLSLIHTPGVVINPGEVPYYPDPETLYDDVPMLYDPLTGRFNLDIPLVSFDKTGNYSVRITYDDGALSRSRTLPFMVIQDCIIQMEPSAARVLAGERLIISGRVLDLQGVPIADETLLLAIFEGEDGFGDMANPALAALANMASDVTTAKVKTSPTGEFAYLHRTLRGQSGMYTVTGYLVSSVVAASGNCNFEILNAGFDSPGANITMPKNYTHSKTVTLRNSSIRALTNVRVDLSEVVAANGVEARLVSSVPSVLSAGQAVQLTVVLEAEEVADDAAQYRLSFSCNEGIERTYDLNVTLRDSGPSIRFSESMLKLGMNPGDTLFRRVTATNRGLGTLRNFTVSGAPNLPWVTVNYSGVRNLEPGAALELEVVVNPHAASGLGLYRGYITLTDEKNISFRMGIEVELTSATRGGVSFTVA